MSNNMGELTFPTRERILRHLMLHGPTSDENNKPLIMELGILFKNKFGGYDYRPNEFVLNVSRILDLYDTNEELDPLS